MSYNYFESIFWIVFQLKSHIRVPKNISNYFKLTAVVKSSQANEILSSFDDRLRHYATKQLQKVRNFC